MQCTNYVFDKNQNSVGHDKFNGITRFQLKNDTSFKTNFKLITTGQNIQP